MLLGRWKALPHLKVTFASLVTDGAVQGVVDKQKLHDSLSCFPYQLCVGLDLHSRPSGHGAGRDRLGRLGDLHQAHPTVACHRQLLVVAKPGHLYTCCLACLDERGALGNRHRLPVYRHLNRIARRGLASCYAAMNPTLS